MRHKKPSVNHRILNLTRSMPMYVYTLQDSIRLVEIVVDVEVAEDIESVLPLFTVLSISSCLYSVVCVHTRSFHIDR